MKKFIIFILKRLGLYKSKPEKAEKVEREIKVLKQKIKEVEDGTPEENVDYLNSDDKLQ